MYIESDSNIIGTTPSVKVEPPVQEEEQRTSSQQGKLATGVDV